MKSLPTASVVLMFVVVGSALIGVLNTTSDQDEQDEDINVRLRRFLMTHNSNMPWTSWRQHVACLTTCVKGYEAETVACCTTGDNRLCFNLPFGLLNSSIGNCPDFCQRKSAINCGPGTAQVCGSDGVTYPNICELSKATCTNDTLREAKSGPCPQVTTPPMTSAAVTPTPTTSVTLDPLFKVFCDNKDSVTCTGGIDIVCDSTKHFHKNSCEFAKLRCDNPSLTSMPLSFCRTKQ